MNWETKVEISLPDLATSEIVTSQTIDALSISYGRQTPDENFTPTTLRLRLLRDSSLGIVGDQFLAINNPISVYVSFPSLGPLPPQITRFSGRITDVRIGKDVADIVAVSQIFSRLGRLGLPAAITGTFTPEDALFELYYQTSFSWGTLTAVVPSFDLGTFTQELDLPSGTNALQAWQSVARSEPSGCLFETLDGSTLDFTDVNSRKFLTEDFTFTGDELLDSWQARKAIGSFANRTVVRYDLGEEIYEDPTSVLDFGAFERTVSTYVADQADAEFLAVMLTYRSLDPKYTTDGITLNMGILSDTRKEEIVNPLTGLRIGSAVEIPSIDGALTNKYFVEGWDEQISASRWLMRLYLSDYRITRAPQVWDDIPASTSWADIATNQPALSWNLATVEWVE